MLRSLSKMEKLSVFSVLLLIMGMGGILISSNPSATGHVAAVYTMKNLEVVVINNQSYSLESKDESFLELKSVMVSGKVIGEGDVNIYVKDKGEKYLVYTNEVKESSLIAITGFMIKETGEIVKEEDLFDVDFKLIEEDILPDFTNHVDHEHYSEELLVFLSLLEKEEKIKGKGAFLDFVQNSEGVEFIDACEETCSLFGLNSNKYEFIFEVDHGVVLILDRIVYSIEKVE